MKTSFFCFTLFIVILALSVRADINGTITDTAGNPVAYATVRSKHFQKSVLSNEKGRFSFAVSSISMRPALPKHSIPPLNTSFIYDLRGRVIQTPSAKTDAHRYASALYVTKFESTGISGKMVKQENRFFLNSNHLNRSVGQNVSYSGNAADTLFITRRGYKDTTLFVAENSGDLGSLSLQTATTGLAVTTIASDYSSANFDLITTDSFSVKRNLITIHSDNKVRAFGSDVFILERLGKDNVIRFCAESEEIGYQQNLGTAINIHDIAIADSNKAYITANQSNFLIVFDIERGEKVSEIDLSEFSAFAGTDSAESHPYMSSALIFGEKLYVACQRLKIEQSTFGPLPVPGDTSVIVIIDTKSDLITGYIPLHKKNPASMYIFHNRLYVSSSGSWSDNTDGGIECIDLETDVNLGVVATEEDFGGEISYLVVVSPERGYVCTGKISDDFLDYWTEVIPFNPLTGESETNIEGVKNGFGGLAYDGFNLYVGEREQGSSGVLVIDVSTDTVLTKVSTGLPPSDISVIQFE